MRAINQKRLNRKRFKAKRQSHRDTLVLAANAEARVLAERAERVRQTFMRDAITPEYVARYGHL